MVFENGTSFENSSEVDEVQLKDRRQKGFKGLPMEGGVARWYARLRSSGSQIEVYRRQASELTGGLPSGAGVLEVAPGPIGARSPCKGKPMS